MENQQYSAGNRNRTDRQGRYNTAVAIKTTLFSLAANGKSVLSGFIMLRIRCICLNKGKSHKVHLIHVTFPLYPIMCLAPSYKVSGSMYKKRTKPEYLVSKLVCQVLFLRHAKHFGSS